MTNAPRPRTGFDWRLYGDATFAGLATLIPIPLLDDVFEGFFRRRMVSNVAALHGVTLPPITHQILSEDGSSWSCLTLPIKGVVYLVRKISRKILYFLTIKQAADKLTFYWQRAFLIDYMLQSGHIQTPEAAQQARVAMDLAQKEAGGSLRQLARQVVGQARHVWRSLRRARKGAEDAMVQQTRQQLDQEWGQVEDTLQTIADRYQRAYAQLGQPGQPGQLA